MCFYRIFILNNTVKINAMHEKHLKGIEPKNTFQNYEKKRNYVTNMLQKILE